MRAEKLLMAHIVCTLIVASVFAMPASGQEVDCTQCHADLTKKKVVHAAVQMGCKTCHTDLDVSTVPHMSKGKVAKGLSAEAPALCNNCHESKLFQGKLVHAPVAAGMCTGCHNPHASDYVGLLAKEPAALCLDCHPDVKKTPHVVAGFTSGSHPLGDAKKAKEVADPLRPGKIFYCAACHEPHRSELPRLNRFTKGTSSCQKCHNI
jgi:predicted CXXCH cytochrome family protein